jgi:hypothetical protein
MKVSTIGTIKKTRISTNAGSNIKIAVMVGWRLVRMAFWGGAGVTWGAIGGRLGAVVLMTLNLLSIAGLDRRRRSENADASPEWPSRRRSLEEAVGFLVVVDVLDRLVQRLLGVSTVQNVLSGLGEFGGDERVSRRYGPQHS